MAKTTNREQVEEVGGRTCEPIVVHGEVRVERELHELEVQPLPHESEHVGLPPAALEALRARTQINVIGLLRDAGYRLGQETDSAGKELSTELHAAADALADPAYNPPLEERIATLADFAKALDEKLNELEPRFVVTFPKVRLVAVTCEADPIEGSVLEIQFQARDKGGTTERCDTCRGERWVCEEHPSDPQGHEGCKGAGMPCKCNPEAIPAFDRVLAERTHVMTEPYIQEKKLAEKASVEELLFDVGLVQVKAIPDEDFKDHTDGLFTVEVSDSRDPSLVVQANDLRSALLYLQSRRFMKLGCKAGEYSEHFLDWTLQIRSGAELERIAMEAPDDHDDHQAWDMRHAAWNELHRRRWLSVKEQPRKCTCAYAQNPREMGCHAVTCAMAEGEESPD